MRLTVVCLMVLLSGCTSVAGDAPPTSACSDIAEPWRGARTMESATGETGAALARLAVGEAVHLRLNADPEVTYLTLPKGAGEAESFGGLASFTAERAGTYRVGLEESSWVDVAENGRPVEAGRFGPGPACSGIRKAVEFTLLPGPHVLELSGNEDAVLGVLIELLPQT